MRWRLALLLIVLTPPLWTACASDAPQAGIEPIAAEAPATEDTAEALRVFTEDKSRLKRVEYRVRVGGAEFCSSISRPSER